MTKQKAPIPIYRDTHSHTFTNAVVHVHESYENGLLCMNWTKWDFTKTLCAKRRLSIHKSDSFFFNFKYLTSTYIFCLVVSILKWRRIDCMISMSWIRMHSDSERYSMQFVYSVRCTELFNNEMRYKKSDRLCRFGQI